MYKVGGPVLVKAPNNSYTTHFGNRQITGIVNLKSVLADVIPRYSLSSRVSTSGCEEEILVSVDGPDGPIEEKSHGDDVEGHEPTSSFSENHSTEETKLSYRWGV